jgi:hypothetical protein
MEIRESDAPAARISRRGCRPSAHTCVGKSEESEKVRDREPQEAPGRGHGACPTQRGQRPRRLDEHARPQARPVSDMHRATGPSKVCEVKDREKLRGFCAVYLMFHQT